MSTSNPSPPSTAPASELLVSSALHLMTHYSAQAGQEGACVKLASVIERHLKALAAHGELSPVLRATCQQLAQQWADVVDQAMPRLPRRTLFGLFADVAR
jgi:hypothetical protein